jgi:hypothetical protein
MRKIVLLVILVVIALGLRLYNLDTRGLITDEKFTLVTANGFWMGGANQSAFKKEYFTAKDFWETKVLKDYFDATAHADFGTHIFHNGFLHYWMKAFGNSDYTVRLPSVLFNVLNVILIFLMVFKYFRNYWAAFLAALLFAIDPLNVAQSHIARSYPLSFLLITLSTEYFIRIVRNEGKSTRNFVIYTILVGMSLLNHYINFFVPLAHVLVFFGLRNKAHLWKGFIMAALVNAGLLFYWFNWGGGYTAFDFLKDKNEWHNTIAESSDDELSLVIQKSSPDLIAKKGIELFYDIGVVGHGLFEKIKGVKVFISSFLVFFAVLIAVKFKNRAIFKWGSVLAALLLLAYQRHYFLGITVSVGIFIGIYFAIRRLRESYSNENQKGQFVILTVGLLMLVLPLIFVINDAFTSGNTTSLTHRYIGNASPFVVMLMAVGIVSAIDYNKWFMPLFVIVFITQFGAVKKGILDYFDDRSVYNAYFQPRRVKNPYITAAEILKSTAVKGDTILIPGAYRNKYEQRFQKDLTFVTYTDAQYLNLYLSKDFDVVQHVDKNEREKLYLKKKNGHKQLIFDFKGEEFRY